LQQVHGSNSLILSMGLQVSQSQDDGGVAGTLVCILSSAAAGVGIGLFCCVVSLANKLQTRNGGVHTRCSRRVHVLGIVGHVVCGLASLFGVVTGSVSLATVVRSGCTLPANAFFSQVFRLRPLVRDDILGALITICGVVCFTTFQGEVQASHGAVELLSQMVALPSIVWLVLLCTTLIISLCWLRLRPVSLIGELYCHRRHPRRALVTTLVCACSSAFMDLSTKVWSASFSDESGKGSRHWTLWPAIVINIALYLVMRWGIVYGCRHCDVLVFMPFHTTVSILTSMITGMVVLQEYRAVSSWPGLGATVVSMLIGIIMLVTGPDAASAKSAVADDASALVVADVEREDGNLDQNRPKTAPTLLQSGPLQRKGLHAATDAGGGVDSPSRSMPDVAGSAVHMEADFAGSAVHMEADFAGSPVHMDVDTVGRVDVPSSVFVDAMGSNDSIDCKEQTSSTHAQNSAGDLCWCLSSQVLPHASGICCLNHAHWHALSEGNTGNHIEAIAGAMRSGSATRARAVANTVRRWRSAAANEATRALAQARAHAGRDPSG